MSTSKKIKIIIKNDFIVIVGVMFFYTYTWLYNRKKKKNEKNTTKYMITINKFQNIYFGSI